MTANDDSQRDGGSRYAIGELSELGGVSRRTVRYYIQRRLLAAPTGVGRGRHYTQRHLDTLIRIRELQESGLPLAEIARRLADRRDPADPPRFAEASAADRLVEQPSYSSWTRVEIADGVELHLRDRRLDSRQARAVGEAILGILEKRR